jgi:hypothetical protein
MVVMKELIRARNGNCEGYGNGYLGGYGKGK